MQRIFARHQKILRSKAESERESIVTEKCPLTAFAFALEVFAFGQKRLNVQGFHRERLFMFEHAQLIAHPGLKFLVVVKDRAGCLMRIGFDERAHKRVHQRREKLAGRSVVQSPFVLAQDFEKQIRVFRFHVFRKGRRQMLHDS